MSENLSIDHQIKQLINYMLNQDTGHIPDNLYEIIINSTEKPLITTILEHTKGNQTLAAKILGISRITLRKKIKALSL